MMFKLWRIWSVIIFIGYHFLLTNLMRKMVNIVFLAVIVYEKSVNILYLYI